MSAAISTDKKIALAEWKIQQIELSSSRIYNDNDDVSAAIKAHYYYG